MSLVSRHTRPPYPSSLPAIALRTSYAMSTTDDPRNAITLPYLFSLHAIALRTAYAMSGTDERHPGTSLRCPVLTEKRAGTRSFECATLSPEERQALHSWLQSV
eukprot:410335-Rhodomonas_salina.1